MLPRVRADFHLRGNESPFKICSLRTQCPTAGTSLERPGVERQRQRGKPSSLWHAKKVRRYTLMMDPLADQLAASFVKPPGAGRPEGGRRFIHHAALARPRTLLSCVLVVHGECCVECDFFLVFSCLIARVFDYGRVSVSVGAIAPASGLALVFASFLALLFSAASLAVH